MYIFKSKTFEREMKSYENRKEILDEINFIMEKLYLSENLKDLSFDKRLGLKQYKGNVNPVYGIDVGQTSSKRTGAERLLLTTIDLSNELYYPFRNTIDEELKWHTGVMLHKIVKHDEQSRKSKELSKKMDSLSKDINFYELLNIEEKKEIDDLSPENYERFYEPKYNSKTITVLTEDKHETMKKTFYNESASIVTGIAGSGKTELIIHMMHKHALNYPDKQILYISYSDKLISYVNEKTSIYNHENVHVWSLRRLFRDVGNNAYNFETFKTFELFINEYVNESDGSTNHQLKDEVIRFLKRENNLHKIYSDIYGLIFGSMLLDYSRLDNTSELITLEQYESQPNDYSYFNNIDKKIIYSIATLYLEYLKVNKISSFNTLSFELLKNKVKNKNTFDYIFVDEVQDLTEIQIVFLVNLLKEKKNILLTGDIKQVINPTFFKESRIKSYYKHIDSSITPYSLPSKNFRNSKSIVQLINFINGVRQDKLPSLKLENYEIEKSQNTKTGNIYLYNSSEDELINLFDTGDSAIISSDKETYSYLNSKYSNPNIYTVQEIKGQEFDHICIVNLLSDYKKEFTDILNSKSKITDGSLHYIFNLFYVALTRSKYNLIFYEKDNDFLNLILENIDIKVIDDISELDLQFDISVTTLFNRGMKLIDNGEYERALNTFIRCEFADGYNDHIALKTLKMIDISNIYIKYLDDELKLAKEFENRTYYDYAAKHFDNLNRPKLSSIMTLMNGDLDLFETKLKRERLDILDLYGIKDVYNNELNNYYNNKINYINNQNDFLNEFINETNKFIKEIKILKGE